MKKIILTICFMTYMTSVAFADIVIVAPSLNNDVCQKEAHSLAKVILQQYTESNEVKGQISSVKITGEDAERDYFREYTAIGEVDSYGNGTVSDLVEIKMLLIGCSVSSVSVTPKSIDE